MNEHKAGIYEKYVKRFIDVLFAVTVLLLFWWLYLLIAVIVRVKIGKPVLFSQLRPGYNEKIFRMYKFRSMTDDRDEEGNLLPDRVRLTPVGDILRKSSLDELPEIFNILKGDMSLIGPRPQLVRDMVFMTDEQRRRALVKPGLTGLAQINGRNAITWDKKLAYDQEYVDSISFITDLKIFFGTFAEVLRHEDVNMEGEATSLDLGDCLLKERRVTKEEYKKKQEEALELIRKSGL